MAVRLMEMQRILKPTVKAFICIATSTASHYLKLLMDAVFGTAILSKQSSGELRNLA